MDYQNIQEITNYKKIPLGNSRDLRAIKSGHLTPLYRTENHNKFTQWLCKCDCGKYKVVYANHLVNNHTTSCGCKTGINYIGQTYGELTILEDLGNSTRKIHNVKCQCSCGNVIICNLNNLKCGHKTTCGEKQNHLNRFSHNDLKDKKFGKLIVLEQTDKRIDNKIVWKCLCECGNTCEVISTNLIKGNTTSCGCVKSKGEELINSLLSSHQISYVTQKKFDTCYYKDTNKYCLFDFYVDNSYLIEYDGSQHYKGWSQNQDDLLKQQEHDDYKTKWCQENNIPLIRIPYWEFDTLNINDLLLETTKYRIV